MVLLIASIQTQASDSLFVKLSSHEIKKGDTLDFDCVLKSDQIDRSKITLNVWIESIGNNKRWKFRYPLIDGYTTASLVLGDSIPPGNYAVNFLVQKDLLQLKGKVRDHNPKSKGLNYLVFNNKKLTYFGILNPDSQGNFKTTKILFENNAQFVFTEIGKKSNNLFIDVVNTLDSTFTPLCTQTEFIKVGAVKDIDTSINKSYQFELIEKGEKFTLKDVIVKSVKKSRLNLFEETYASGLFKFSDARTFDGLEDKEIANSFDIFAFLQARIAGLKITNNMGTYDLSWRGGPVDIYLDEFKVDEDIARYVNPSDVAMIKVFSPGSGTMNGNGTIAIYTKRGEYIDDASRKYYFLVHGYTPYTSIWE